MSDDLISRAADPTTPLEDLAVLAFEHPETRRFVAANPSTYDDLLGWLRDLDDPAVNDALASRGLVGSAPPTSAQVIAASQAAPSAVVAPRSDPEVAPSPVARTARRIRRVVATVPALLWLAGGTAAVVLIIASGVGATIQAAAEQRLREEQVAFDDRVAAAQEQANPEPPPTSEASAPTPEAPAPSLQRTTTTVVVTDSDGFQQTMTVTLGPVILGSNTSLMESEWSSVGGAPGSNPCIDINPGNDLSTNYVIDADLAGFAFGTIAITNDRPDFPPRDVIYIFSRNSSSAMGVGFSNSAVCDGLGAFPFNPAFDEGADWGPVPIVIAIADVRTPAYPSGDPTAVSGVIRVNMNAASIPLQLYSGN